jgi:hypothetical protein
MVSAYGQLRIRNPLDEQSCWSINDTHAVEMYNMRKLKVVAEGGKISRRRSAFW